MSFGKTVTLNTGATIPVIGLGTWQSKTHEVENAVEIAVRNGYRHLDLAMVYQNQEEIGKVFKRLIPSVVKREELFITSKLWNSGHQPAEAVKEFNKTLEQLGLEYLDLYLIHWPVAFKPGEGLFPLDPAKPNWNALDTETSLVDTWKALIDIHKTGKVRSIGVSNFPIPALESIIAATGVVPAVNQVEAHPQLPQDDLVAYCKEKNIHITAYSALGNNVLEKPLLTENPLVKEIAEKLKATPAQVLIAWGVKRGYSSIPKSVQESRIKSNFQQIELPDEDYEKITEYGKKNPQRWNIPYTTSNWDINLFEETDEKSATFKARTN